LSEEKQDFIHMFHSYKTAHKADFIAIRLEETRRYYLQKCRVGGFPNLTGTIIDEELFFKMFKACKSPIILSDSYTKINSNLDMEMEMREFHLNAASRFNHGCVDSAILSDIGNGTCIVTDVMSCHSCWQVGHDANHEYMAIGDIFNISEILEHPDLEK